MKERKIFLDQLVDELMGAADAMPEDGEGGRWGLRTHLQLRLKTRSMMLLMPLLAAAGASTEEAQGECCDGGAQPEIWEAGQVCALPCCEWLQICGQLQDNQYVC